MASVKYHLNKPKGEHGLKKKPCPIIAKFFIGNGVRFDIATGEKIVPKYWNFENQAPKASYPGHTELNIALSNLEQALLQFWRENKSLDTDEFIKQARNIPVTGTTSERVEKKNNDLELFILEFIKKCEEGKISRKPVTVQKYRAVLSHLQEFCRIHKYELTFDAITLEFYYDFCQFLWDVKKHCDATVGNQVKYLKTFMQEAYSMDLHTNLSFQKKQFKKFEGETDSVYLTEEEILKIYNIDLVEKGRPDLIESRDLFVFDCWVGLRYSDLTRIKPEHVNGNTIRIRTTKTGEDVVIPFHHIAQAIFRKYGNALPKAKSNPQYNADLKDIARLADLRDSVQRRRIIRSTADCEWVEKWQQVTAHTARRSFATNCYKLGVPTRSIMAITGHKTEKAFNKYIKISKEEHASIMAEIFQRQPLMKIA
jgi:integrase